MTHSMALYRRLLSYVRPYRQQFLLAIFGMIALAATEPMLPALLKPLLDEGFVAQNHDTMRLIPLWLLGIAILRGTATFIGQVGITWVAAQVVKDLRKALFQRLLQLPSHTYDNYATGTLLSKVTYDVSRVMQAATESLTILVKDSLIVMGLLGFMFYINWMLSLIIFTILPLIALVIRWVSKKLRRNNQGIQTAMGELTRILEESISGHKLVKIFAGQDYENKRFQRSAQAVCDYEIKVKIAANSSIFIVQLLTASALAIIIYIAAFDAGNKLLSVGEFVALLTAMGLLFSPIKRLTKVNEQLQQGLAAAQSIFDLLDSEIEIDAGKQQPQKIQGNIRLQQLNFSYESDSEIVLKQLNLDIKAGESIAIVGRSGSGKTTLVNLLARFYPLKDGQIFIDEHDINSLKINNLRQHIALVSQEVILFNDTIAANIAYGSMANSPISAITAAAKAAYALEFIQALPNGFDTIIGERGVKLSGGQRQRLAIARALLKDAPILIFDEATSALDTQSEQQVQKALEKLKQNRTTFIIAHRLSTIEKADKILVMQQGKIIEMGTHQS